MNNINKTINSLNNKLDSIKSKSNLTEKDIKIINKGITNLRDNLKEYSNNNKLTDLTNKTVATVLRSTIKTVLSTPTSDSVSYNSKKKFLANSPDILHIDIEHFPSSYTKNYINQNKYSFYGGSIDSKIADVPGNTYLNAPKSLPVSNPQVNHGIVGCLSNVNNCGSNRLTAFSQGNIGCSNMSEQGGQKFIFPNKIIDRN